MDNITKHENESSISENLRTFCITVDVFIVGALCLSGLVGNILSIVVLRRFHDKRSTTTWTLQTLAVADIMYLCSCIFIQSVNTIHKSTTWWPQLSNVYPYIALYAWPCASTLQTITTWIVLYITIDRYLVVSRPFTARTRKRYRAVISIAVICISAAIYNIPRFMERKVVRIGKGFSVRMTSLRENEKYFLIYKVLLHCIFRSIGPLVLLLAFNIGLVKTLSRAKETQKQLTTNAAQNHNLTLMLITVVAVFITCQLPDTTLRMVFAITRSVRPVYSYINVVSNCLLTFNSAVNFLVYCFAGTKFRRHLKEMFLKNG